MRRFLVKFTLLLMNVVRLVKVQTQYFEIMGLEETDVYLHADNCTGQNKNNAMIKYLMWRTLMSLHTNIVYSYVSCCWTHEILSQLLVFWAI